MYWLMAIVGILGLGVLYDAVSRQRDRSLPLMGRLVDVGGYRLHITESGSGTPPVVIISGAGDSSASWIHVRNQVARFARVVTYDRPGLGSSDAGPAPDADRSVEELRTLLQRAGIHGPYLLVGHSLGGIFARLYAIRYPDEVAGMVFVDSSHESLLDDVKFRKGFAAVGFIAKVSQRIAWLGLFRFLGSVLGVMPMYPERRYYQPTLSADEYRHWLAAAHRNAASAGAVAEVQVQTVFPILEEARRQMQTEVDQPQFGATPIAVLTNPGFGQGWVESHRELASRSSNSIHQVSDRNGHSIQMARPELVVQAIQHVLAQIGAKGT